MKKNKKIILILLLIALLLINSIVLASEVVNPENYKPSTLERTEAGRTLGMAEKMLAAIRNVGVVISVIILSIIGLKYMMCSVDEKANYKENMIPYVVGCLLLAMSSTIPSIIYDVLN